MLETTPGGRNGTNTHTGLLHREERKMGKKDGLLGWKGKNESRLSCAGRTQTSRHTKACAVKLHTPQK
jgi:hypothetical protein